MLDALQIIAERRITEAIREGKFNSDKWKGKPLPVEDNSFVPDDLRMAYKVLKNAGFLPPEIETKKEISKLEELIAKTDDEHTRLKQLNKLNFLILKLNSMRKSAINLEKQEEYHHKVVEKISVSR